MGATLRQWVHDLDRPVDAASLAFFRVAFGAALLVLALRFFTHGWIAADYLVPTVFFHYWGFGWVKPWPGVGMYLHYGVMAVAAACITLGIVYRAAAVVFAVTFTYAHLCDKANFLNHYYLVGLVAFLFVLVPLDREASLRVLLRPADRAPSVRRWVLLLLRFQFGLVYVFGGLAKVGSDWLLRGEPLRIWLAANVEMPVLGRLFLHPGVAVAASWCGMVFDLTIVGFLLWRRTRAAAYAAVLLFHGLTALLFRIGMFPWLMSIAATLFFDPSWPRRLLRSLHLQTAARAEADNGTVAGARLSGASMVALVGYALVQLLMPLRHFVYPGDTLWSEEGFRYAWRVMLVEKGGSFELTVVDARGHRVLVEPREYLTPYQARMASTQPDMILELAHIVARDFDRRGVGPVQVFARASVSFNGRPHAPLIDPTVDLTREDDYLGSHRFILPAPTVNPPP